MPVPKPQPGQSKDEFMAVCMKEVSKNKDRTNEQNVAICMSTWREAKGQKKSLDRALFRSARIESGAVDADKRTVGFSFSSRHPVRRRLFDKTFREVLSHDPGAIDTGRLDRGVVPLLWNHNWDNRIGIVRNYAIRDGRAYALAELSPNQNGQDALRDIQAGIQSAVSVGYIPRTIRCLRKRSQNEPDDKKLRLGHSDDDPDNDIDPDDSTDDDFNDDDDDQDDLYEISRWEPIEISLVSVPADPTVGVGRGFSEVYEVRMLDEFDDAAPELKVNLLRERTPMSENMTVSVSGATVTGNLPPNFTGVSPATIDQREDVGRIREAELSRIREIQGFGVQFECVDDAHEYIRSGKTVAEFQTYLLRERLPKTKPVTIMTDPSMGFGPRDRGRYSIVRAINSQIQAQKGRGRFDGLEAEVSAELARAHNQDPQGFFVPDWFLTRDLTVTPPPGGGHGGLTVQTTVEPSLIPLLRNRTAVLQAGARYISGLQGNLLMPRQNAPSTISWNTEVAPVTESDLNMDSVTLSPNRVGGWCTYSKQLLAQSSLDIDNIVRDDMIQVIQIAIDAVAISGTGTNQPTGILNVPANAGLPYNYADTAPSITFPTGGFPTWTEVVQFEGNIEAGNVILNDTAKYITSPQVKAAWKTYAKNDPRNAAGPYFPVFYWEPGDQVNGYGAIATNQVPANKVIFGKWDELMIGQWAGLDIVVDIYTKAPQAEINVITNMFCDVKYRYASAFCFSTNSGISN